MNVSVVICTYSLDLYDDLQEAIASVLNQTYDDVEVVVVVDGNTELYRRIQREWADDDRVHTTCNEENRGLSASRNRGIELANGDVIAFMDDDAVAEERWIAELVAVYEERDEVAVGGRMKGRWVAGRPAFLPQEFYWLVGVTHRGFPDEGEVRNTFGSNISFRAGVLEAIGGFDENLGRKGDRHVQGEETELAARLREESGRTVYYNPDAVVEHKVFEYRTKAGWLLKRAFWQGYSKRAMETILPDSSGQERDFLSFLLTDSAPERAKKLIRRPSLRKLTQFVMLFVFTAAVGFGYLYGFRKW